MRTNRFWDFIEGCRATEGKEYLAEVSEGSVTQAIRMLNESIPIAARWTHFRPVAVNGSPIFLLMAALYEGSHGENSPRAWKYAPEDVTLHLDSETFEEVLFQTPPRGAVCFFWDTFDFDDSFHQLRAGQRIAMQVRSKAYEPGLHFDPETGKAEGGYLEYTAAAIGFIHGTKVEVFAFPISWMDILDKARHDLDRMTAKEKAAKQLPHELKAFVDLLGWDAVNAALQQLRDK